MSYKGFKRVLGESNIERKCRWWFGVSLTLMLFLSFYWYGREMENLVYRGDRDIGPELVRNALFQAHFDMYSELEELLRRLENQSELELERDPTAIEPSFPWVHGSLGGEVGRDFDWYAILPQNPNYNPEHKNAPQDAYEQELLKNLSSGEISYDDTKDSPKFDRRIMKDGEQKYRFYQPIYADRNCTVCHTQVGAIFRPNLVSGDLMAIIRVEMDQEDTRRQVARTQATLWVVAIVIGFLAMFLLWFIVRYVIVKPVQHLRAVSDAVREGDIEQRADIHTGDEFEDLAAAFNRMLRRLLQQQDTLQEVNEELDAKIDQLAQANMRLFEMNRLKSDFLATMSHELRTPLNSILGFSEVLSTINTLDDKQKRYVANIQRSGKMLLEMINDILDLAKMESGKMDVRPTDFRIDTVVAAQCDMARPLSERKNIDLEFYSEPKLPTIRQDQAKLQQILNNLLSNAIKFTPEGGRITVAARRAENGDLELEVQDTGIGISENDQQLVFEKFRQGGAAAPRGDAMTREHSGTGLGLSIVRELCRLLGGDVTLRSTVGKGSTFIVQLPWSLTARTDLDAELQKGVAELTRPAMAPVSATTES